MDVLIQPLIYAYIADLETIMMPLWKMMVCSVCMQSIIMILVSVSLEHTDCMEALICKLQSFSVTVTWKNLRLISICWSQNKVIDIQDWLGKILVSSPDPPSTFTEGLGTRSVQFNIPNSVG